MTTALLLIDIQNEYFPGGKNELVHPLEASQCARQVLDCFRQKGLLLVHIQHISVRPGATTFLPSTPGIEIHQNVYPLPGETIFQKNYPNSFRGTPLLEHLQGLGVRRLVIAGMMTHMCVDASTRAAFDYGFECVVVHDACATRALKFGEYTVPAEHVHASFLAALASMYGRVLSTQETIAIFE